MSISQIPGLVLRENVLSPQLETKIIEWLDSLEWSTELRRRTIHRGYNYPYRGGALTSTRPLDGHLLNMALALSQDHIFGAKDGQPIVPQQCIVNEYLRGQGIGAHSDRNDFGPIIAAYSLNAGTNMIFTEKSTGQKVELYLPPRSLFIMTGPSRYQWTHEIPIRTFVNTPQGMITKQDDYRRISVTFRTVN